MASDYISLSIELPVSSSREETIAQLSLYGFDGFWEEDEELKAYIPEATFNDQLRKDVDQYCQQEGFSCLWEELPDQNWNKKWESNFNPVMIHKQCLVRAPFHDANPDIPFDIIIEPQMSFGTGHHETTSMMVELILDLKIEGENILDMGTGTGILAILAQMKGAGDILAIDNDEWAYNNTLNNIGWNKIEGFDVVLGDVLSIKNKSFDIIFANINRNILLRDIIYYAETLKESGKLLMSGFYAGDLNSISEVAIRNGLSLERKISLNDWTAVQYIKKN